MNKMFVFNKFFILLSLFLTACVSHKESCKEIASFSVSDVHINDGAFKKAEELDSKVIQSIDADRLLYTFRANAGIANPKGVSQYGGWESSDLRGHTMGHYLTAMSYRYAITSDVSIKANLNYVVNELANCQERFNSGFLSAFPESILDKVDSTGEGWAPYYTLHKILQGLIDVYRLTSNHQALQVASHIGDYLYERTLRITNKDAWKVVLDKMEQGGIAESLLNLYQLTGKKEYLKCACFFHQHDKLEPALNHKDVLNSRITSNYNHSNTTIPQFIGAVRMYEVTGDASYRESARFFWEEVATHRSYSNGSTGYHEHWNYGPDTLSLELGGKAGETCCTYNMIKLSNDLFRIEPNAKYADYVERALFNHILGSIHPETGDFMYLHTMESGSFKTFGKNTDVFWCCTGTGMENHVRYAESFYFKGKKKLYINQYVPSTLNWNEQRVEIEQRTKFPEKSETEICIKKGFGVFDILLRVPYWCKQRFSVQINGKPIKVKVEENGYCVLHRSWKQNDRIQIQLPMSLWALPTPDAPDIASIMYGPLVLAGDLGTEGVTDKLIRTTNNFYGEIPESYKVNISIPRLTGNLSDLSWISRIDSTQLCFRTNQTEPQQILYFYPLYSFYKNRFAAYWHFKK